MNRESFRKNLDGKGVDLFQISDGNNLRAFITNYGARIASLLLKKDGKEYSVVMGYDSLDGYLNTKDIYHGTVVGRYANRIRQGKFSLHGKQYTLNTNNGPNHLHGGPTGFHARVWEVYGLGDNSILLSLTSPDGEEGYPGTLTLSVRYTLNEMSLEVEFTATTDATTILNVTNHAYFNLNGIQTGDSLSHLLKIEADQIIPVDETLIPTGKLMDVSYTPFDFRQFHSIGERINDDHEQIKIGNGYDHNFVLKGSGFRKIAEARGDKSGISMEVSTDQPGVQLYTDRKTFCLETQHFPDSPNQPSFPSTELKKGETFKSKTIFRFSQLQ